MTDAGWEVLQRSNCLGETLIARSGMTAEQVQALNRQVQGLRDALGGFVARI